MGKSTVITDDKQDKKINDYIKGNKLKSNTSAGVLKELLEYDMVLTKESETETKTQKLLESLYKKISSMDNEIKELKLSIQNK